MNDSYVISPSFDIESRLVLFAGDVNSFLKTLPSSFIDLIITSPPYNLGKTYETKIGLRRYLENQSLTIEQLIRVLSNKGSVCWQVGNYVENGEVYPLDIYYYDIFKELGLKLRNRIIWHFGHGLHSSKRFSGRYETILWFSKTDDYVFNLDSVRVKAKYPGKRYYKGPNKGKLSSNPQGKNPSDFWKDIINEEFINGVIEIPNVKSNHPEKTIHPCQYPIELVERFILALSNEDDWVFDPYSGVGSSLLAAIKNNRKCIGAEKEEKYVEISRKRIDDFLHNKLNYRPLGKPIYEPTGKEKVAQIPLEWLDKK